MVDEQRRPGGRPKTRHPDDPPTIETAQTAIPEMPEQRHLEPKIPDPPTIEVEEAKVEAMTDAQRERMEDERFIRVRVKRIGGFVKGLADYGKELARERMKKYGRTEKDGWDMSIHIPGFDNCSHVHNQKALFEKPVKMIQIEKAAT